MIQNLHDNEICSLIRGPQGSEVVLGFERKGNNSLVTFWVTLRRELSSTFGPDFRSVSWQRKEGGSGFSIQPQVQNAVDHMRQGRDSLYKNIFQEEYAASKYKKFFHNLITESGYYDKMINTEPSIASNSAIQENENRILQIHSEAIHRRKYYLIVWLWFTDLLVLNMTAPAQCINKRTFTIMSIAHVNKVLNEVNAQ